MSEITITNEPQVGIASSPLEAEPQTFDTRMPAEILAEFALVLTTGSPERMLPNISEDGDVLGWAPTQLSKGLGLQVAYAPSEEDRPTGRATRLAADPATLAERNRWYALQSAFRGKASGVPTYEVTRVGQFGIPRFHDPLNGTVSTTWAPGSVRTGVLEFRWSQNLANPDTVELVVAHVAEATVFTRTITNPGSTRPRLFPSGAVDASGQPIMTTRQEVQVGDDGRPIVLPVHDLMFSGRMMRQPNETPAAFIGRVEHKVEGIAAILDELATELYGLSYDDDDVDPVAAAADRAAVGRNAAAPVDPLADSPILD